MAMKLYGCMHLGGSWDNQAVQAEHQNQADEVLDFLLSQGVIAFDHADIYCRGKSEVVFGNFLFKSGVERSQLFIQSKCGIQLGVGSLGSSHYRFDKDYIIQQTLNSIKNLQCDYLDALLLHRPDPLWQPDSVSEAFDWLKKEGLVKSFGVSNMSPSLIQRLKTFWSEIKYNQVQFSLGHSHLIKEEVFYNTDNSNSVDTGFFPFHATNEIQIQAWGPLDQGKYLQDDGDGIGVSNLVSQLANKYGTTREVILLAWVNRLPHDIVPILGSMKIDRIKAALDYDKIHLDHSDWYNLFIEAIGSKIP
jgi:predicted oxidoreductase